MPAGSSTKVNTDQTRPCQKTGPLSASQADKLYADEQRPMTWAKYAATRTTSTVRTPGVSDDRKRCPISLMEISRQRSAATTRARAEAPIGWWILPTDWRWWVAPACAARHAATLLPQIG